MVGRLSFGCDDHVDTYDDAYDHNSSDGGTQKKTQSKSKKFTIWGPEAPSELLVKI